jgi:hypothetical protein
MGSTKRVHVNCFQVGCIATTCLWFQWLLGGVQLRDAIVFICFDTLFQEVTVWLSIQGRALMKLLGSRCSVGEKNTVLLMRVLSFKMYMTVDRGNNLKMTKNISLIACILIQVCNYCKLFMLYCDIFVARDCLVFLRACISPSNCPVNL